MWVLGIRKVSFELLTRLLKGCTPTGPPPYMRQCATSSGSWKRRNDKGRHISMKEIKIEKASNGGYVVKVLDYSGSMFVFSTYAEMMDYLFDYFGEKAKS